MNTDQEKNLKKIVALQNFFSLLILAAVLYLTDNIIIFLIVFFMSVYGWLSLEHKLEWFFGE